MPTTGSISAERRRYGHAYWLLPTLIGLGFRVAYALLPSHPPLVADARFYWETAQSLAAGQGYTSGGVPATSWMPGLPLLLSAVILVLGPSLGAARLVLAVLSAATIPLVARYAEARFGRSTAHITSWAFALYPPFWFFSGAILTETTAILAVTVFLLCALRLGAGFRFGDALGLGLPYVALLYLKPEFALWGPLVLGFSLVRPDRLPRRAALVMCLLGGLALAPWTYRNYRQFGELIPLKATGGMLVWWVSQDPPVEDVNDRTPAQRAIEAGFVVPGKPGATGRNYARAGIQRILAAPRPYLQNCLVHRLPHLFLGSQCEAALAVGLAASFGQLRAAGRHGLLGVKLLLFALQGLIAGLGLAGLLLAPRHPARPLELLLFVATAGVYVALLGITRYSMVLMPFLIPHGARLAEATSERFNPRRAS